MLLGNLLLHEWDVLSRDWCWCRAKQQLCLDWYQSHIFLLSPVPDVKSSLLMVCNFLRDVRWHCKLKHSQKHLEALSFYFYMELTCHLSVLSVVSCWQFNIALVIFFCCCSQHFVFRRWSCKHILYCSDDQISHLVVTQAFSELLFLLNNFFTRLHPTHLHNNLGRK